MTQFLYQSYGDRAGESSVLNEIGIMLRQTSQLGPAEAAFQQAIAVHEQLKRQSGRCEVIGNLAFVLKDKGVLDRALKLLEEKLSIGEHLQSSRLIAFAHYNIGAILNQQNAIGNALDSLNAGRLQFIMIKKGARHPNPAVLLHLVSSILSSASFF
jgi:tetratricopeptide (TPR) repeat protein